MNRLFRLRHILLSLVAVVGLFSCEGDAPFGALNWPTVTPSLEVSPASLTFDAEPTTPQTVVVTSNVIWTASSSASWLTVSPQQGNNAGSLTITAGNNTNTSERSATITVSGGGLTKTVSVSQKAGKPDTPTEDKLTISTGSVNFKSAGETKTVKIEGNLPWEVVREKESSASWLHLNKSEGTAPFDLELTADANADIQPRQAQLTVRAKKGDIAFTINVTQSAANVQFDVTPDVLEFSASGETKSFSVKANIGWNVITNSLPGWLHHEGNTEQNGTTYVRFRTDENTSTNSRDYVVTFDGDGDEVRKVTVRQNGAAPYLRANLASGTDTSFDYSGGTGAISVKSNTRWTVTSSNTACATITSSNSGNGDGNVTFKVNAYSQSADRTATITISADGVSPVTFNITQKGFTVQLDVTPTGPFNDVSYQGASYTFTVVSNTSWKATSSASSWLEVKNSSGTNGGSFDVTVKANEDQTKTRTGEVTVTAGSGSSAITRKIVFTQQKHPEEEFYLTPKDEIRFNQAGTGYQNLKITTPYSWQVQGKPGWLTVTPSSGSGTTTIMLTVAGANTGAQREGDLVIYSAGETRSVHIVQEGATMSLSVDPTSLEFDASGGSQSVTIDSNTTWTVEDDRDWLSSATTSGTGKRTIQIRVGNNSSTSSRTGTVTIKGGGLTATVTVTQKGQGDSADATRDDYEDDENWNE